MLRIKKIQGVWAIVNVHNRDLVECFDTRAEAERYFESIQMNKALKDFDRERTWTSLWDTERGHQ